MPDLTPLLRLPFILPSQAQKHVTHNEALEILDALILLSVEEWTLSEPPATPIEGQRFIVATGATGAWAGQDEAIAYFRDGGWTFFAPQTGWRAEVISERRAVRYTVTGWELDTPNLTGAELDDLDQVGVNASADSANRLSVASPGSLLSHEGTDHRLTINKASAAATSSVVFQTDWTGHAEMGLTGDNAYSIKISADGSTWETALAADPVSNTLDLGLPVTGEAVQSAPDDATPGKLLRVGSFGLGAASPEVLANIDDTALPTGTYQTDGATVGVLPAGAGPVAHVSVQSLDASNAKQILWDPAVRQSWTRWRDGSGWTAWTAMEAEHGSNANGDYTRLADGTQMCWVSTLTSGAVTTPIGALYRSGVVGWNFPAPFSAMPVVHGQVLGWGRWAAITAGGNTSASGIVFATTGSSGASPVSMSAVGRWY